MASLNVITNFCSSLCMSTCAHSALIERFKLHGAKIFNNSDSMLHSQVENGARKVLQEHKKKFMKTAHVNRVEKEFKLVRNA